MTDPVRKHPSGKAQAGTRAAARLAAVQALYQAEMTDAAPDAVAAEFVRHRLGQTIDGDTYRPADEALFRDLVESAIDRTEQLDALIAGALDPDWTVPRLDSVLRALLRCATYELLARPEVPVRVVITEYVTVADAFFSGKEPGLTNAVLDRLGRELRPAEW